MSKLRRVQGLTVVTDSPALVDYVSAEQIQSSKLRVKTCQPSFLHDIFLLMIQSIRGYGISANCLDSLPEFLPTRSESKQVLDILEVAAMRRQKALFPARLSLLTKIGRRGDDVRQLTVLVTLFNVRLTSMKKLGSLRESSSVSTPNCQGSLRLIDRQGCSLHFRLNGSIDWIRNLWLHFTPVSLGSEGCCGRNPR
jgi:hypothetical protein